MTEVAALSADTDRMKTVSIVIVALFLELNAPNAFGNGTVSFTYIWFSHLSCTNITCFMLGK